MTEVVCIGIDPVGGRRPVTFAALDVEGKPLTMGEGDSEDILAIAREYRSAFVAINAPSGPNLGLVRGGESHEGSTQRPRPGRQVEMRVAEHLLRERGIAIGATPSHVGSAPAWMQTGFALG